MANANNIKTHNESLADFNGTRETVDAECHLPKPTMVDAVKANKGVIALFAGIATAVIFGLKLRGDVQEATEAIVEKEEELRL